jgi:hypothetical protein
MRASGEFAQYFMASSPQHLFELGRQARPGRQTGIRLYLPVPAEGQNKYWGHRLTDKAITYQQRYLNNKYASLYA